MRKWNPATSFPVWRAAGSGVAAWTRLDVAPRVLSPMTTWLHEERLRAVRAVLRESGASRVVDLGCGDGDLFVRLAGDPQFDLLVGIDICRTSLELLRARIAGRDVRSARLVLHEASMTRPPPGLSGIDCALMVETIEHLDPAHLSQLEHALFRGIRPRVAVITTPNADFNPLLGVPAHRMRHPGHRFEWGRTRFRHWCGRVAGAAGYTLEVQDLAGHHPDRGGASQMAVFRLAAAVPAGKTACGGAAETLRLSIRQK